MTTAAGRPPRVLMLTSWYPSPDNPVAGVFVREHARAAALHADVRVLHVDEDPGLPGYYSFAKEEDDDLAVGLPTYRVRYRRPLPRLKQIAFVVGVLRASREIGAAGFRPDVVHAHVFLTALPALLLAKRYRCPLVFTEHSSAFPRGLLEPKFLRRTRLAYRRAAMVLPVSRSLQASLESHGVAGRYRVVPNAVDPAVFRPGPGPIDAEGPHRQRRMLFVGSLKPVKGVDVLLKAVSLAGEQLSGWAVDVVGDGEERRALEALSNRLGLGAVTFHGQLPKGAVAEMMRAADLFVLPSRWENLPCVVIEAHASGLPVVATAVGGLPELVDGSNGLLVPPDDDRSLARAIVRAASTTADYEPEQTAARARARFSLAAVGEQLASVYAEVLAKRASAR